MLNRLLGLVVFATSLFLSPLADACFPPEGAVPTSKEVWRTLPTDLLRPHFYYVTGLAVIFVPTEFVAESQLPVARRIGNVALAEHTDIHKPILFGPQILPEVKAIVADALEAGVAVIYDAQRQSYARAVKIVTYSNLCNGGRRFSYDNDGREDELFETLDWVS